MADRLDGDTPMLRLVALLERVASKDQRFSLQALVDDTGLPSLIDQARSTLDRWKGLHGPNLPSYFDEWERVLQRRPEEVAGMIVSMTEDATRLRQSSPFVNVLTPSERSKIFEAFA